MFVHEHQVGAEVGWSASQAVADAYHGRCVVLYRSRGSWLLGRVVAGNDAGRLHHGLQCERFDPRVTLAPKQQSDAPASPVSFGLFRNRQTDRPLDVSLAWPNETECLGSGLQAHQVAAKQRPITAVPTPWSRSVRCRQALGSFGVGSVQWCGQVDPDGKFDDLVNKRAFGGFVHSRADPVSTIPPPIP